MEEKGFEILIADDDQDDVTLIRDLLREAFGAKVKVIDEAASYETAVDLLSRNSYTVALVDYRLGELNGIELLREVRSKDNVTPIIFLTGQGDQEVAVEAMKSGATDYLDKAKLSEGVLAKSIRYAVELHAKEQERRQAQKALQEMTRQRELILNSAGEGIFGMNAQGLITFVNPAASLMLGHACENLVGKDAHATLHHSKQDGSPLPKEQCPHYATLANGVPQHVTDDVFWRQDGSFFPVEYMSTPIVESGKNVGVVITFRDITERKRSEEMIKNMAYHDSLTGLPNRILLYDRINIALTHAQRYNEMLAILFADLDDFKPVNDTLGHAMGDLVLQEVAQRLRACLREGDTVARLGGDEFVILLTQINHAEDVSLTAQKVLDAIRKVFVVGEHEIKLSASIGLTLYPRDGKTRDALLKNADLALYRAKSKDKNRFEIHTD